MTNGFEELCRAVDRVKLAESFAVPGSPDYDLIVKAALYQAWPAIRAFVAMNRPDQDRPRLEIKDFKKYATESKLDPW